MLTPSGPPTGHASIHELQQAAPTGFNLHISGEAAAWKHIGRLDLQTRLDDDSTVLDAVPAATELLTALSGQPTHSMVRLLPVVDGLIQALVAVRPTVLVTRTAATASTT